MSAKERNDYAREEFRLWLRGVVRWCAYCGRPIEKETWSNHIHGYGECCEICIDSYEELEV